MPLNAQARAFVDAFEALPAVDFSTISAADFRTAFAAPIAEASGDEVERVEDRLIDTAAGPLRLRLYIPAGTGRLPVTLYFFGSGFVIGSLEWTDHICRALANRAGSLVVSVDYRLAPEAPFPAAVEDALSALHWVHGHIAEWGGDAQRLAVAGDSSGGNLAAVLAQLARAEGIGLRHQLLLYPPLDAAADTPSYRELATGYGFTAAWMLWYWRQYLPDARSAQDVRASPLRQTDLRGLPSATIFTAECDILRDEAEAYANALQAAGVAVELTRWPGQIHGFILMQGLLDDAELALNAAAAALRRAFA
ncbi:alpha/beta hydrolase [Dyella silvatica]|uniref:alpha/beta hydrolase n=1 Tax=Dyella silvatica TaxID=2992128 RepID=UPI002255C3EE|nr:alpha/beta hydrolase [Dyella silvatica]